MKKLDKAGRRYGLLVVVRRARPRKGITRWLCRCDCGVSTTVYDSSLGKTRSCGCGKHDPSKMIDTEHGRLGPEYQAWASLIQRCTNSNHPSYARYGGRGISVCQRWRNSFDDFFEDMGPRPSTRHSIDRIDNDGDYELSNCRWATLKEQANNAQPPINPRTSITYEGETKSRAAWERERGLPSGIIRSRLSKGWIEIDAIRYGRDTWPVSHMPKGMLEFFGVTMSQKEWAAKLGISASALCQRLKKGWSVEKALTTPGRGA